MCEEIFASRHLQLMPAVTDMGLAMMKDAGEAGDVDPIEFYAEWYLEELSIATYSEARREGRLSCRAFGRLINVDEQDHKRVKKLLGVDGGEYKDFALYHTIVKALGRTAEVAEALPLIIPAVGVEPRGPFYPKATTMSLRQSKHLRDDSYVRKMIAAHKGKGENTSTVDSAAIYLASLFRIEWQDSAEMIDRIAHASCAASDIELTFAHMVLEAVKSTARFLPAVRWLDAKAMLDGTIV